MLTVGHTYCAQQRRPHAAGLRVEAEVSSKTPKWNFGNNFYAHHSLIITVQMPVTENVKQLSAILAALRYDNPRSGICHRHRHGYTMELTLELTRGRLDSSRGWSKRLRKPCIPKSPPRCFVHITSSTKGIDDLLANTRSKVAQQDVRQSYCCGGHPMIAIMLRIRYCQQCTLH